MIPWSIRIFQDATSSKNISDIFLFCYKNMMKCQKYHEISKKNKSEVNYSYRHLGLVSAEISKRKEIDLPEICS